MLALMVAMLLPCAPARAQTEKPRLPPATDLNARLAQAQADPKLADTLMKGGRKVAAFCANCHGEGGNSVSPEVPNLAGQNTAYLLEQLRQFADGRRRNEFMEGMIRAMTGDEKVGAAMFFAAQAVQPREGSASAALLAQGDDLYQKICLRCHGPQGRGNEKIARIAGQQPVYLSSTLKRYRAGQGGRIDPLMASNTKLLTDAHIEALTAHVAAMK